MRLRLLPLLSTVIVTLSVLFSGWFTYEYFGIHQPIEDEVEQVAGVKLVDFKMTNEELHLTVRVSPEASLREVKAALEAQLGEVLEGRLVVLQVEDQTTAALDRFWSESLFHVAESMSLKRYSEIPNHLKSVENQLENGRVVVEMDEKNVYVQLYAGSAYKYVILPRESQMGVWNG
jgi:hypothetical protein